MKLAQRHAEYFGSFSVADELLWLHGLAFFAGFALAQRAATAFRPCSLSSSAVRFFARPLPPNLPSATAAGFFCAFFFVAIRTPLYNIPSAT
jgi:hypothetical protein